MRGGWVLCVVRVGLGWDLGVLGRCGLWVGTPSQERFFGEKGCSPVRMGFVVGIGTRVTGSSGPLDTPGAASHTTSAPRSSRPCILPPVSPPRHCPVRSARSCCSRWRTRCWRRRRTSSRCVWGGGGGLGSEVPGLNESQGSRNCHRLAQECSARRAGWRERGLREWWWGVEVACFG